MKRNIIVVLIYALVSALFSFLAPKTLLSLGLFPYFIINLVVSIALVIATNVVVHYKDNASTKSILINAVVIAAISCILTVTMSQINKSNNELDAMLQNESQMPIVMNMEGGMGNAQGGIPQEILDELDRQAREMMIKEGIISEDDVITTSPYVGGELPMGEIPPDASPIGGSDTRSELVVSVQGQDTMSIVIQTLVNAIVAVAGGFLGRKVWRKRNEAK